MWSSLGNFAVEYALVAWDPDAVKLTLLPLLGQRIPPAAAALLAALMSGAAAADDGLGADLLRDAAARVGHGHDAERDALVLQPNCLLKQVDLVHGHCETAGWPWRQF